MRARSLETWFRRRYSLPPTDPRFLSATIEDIEVDFWTQHYADRAEKGGAVEEFEADFDFEAERARIEAEAEAEESRRLARAGDAGGGDIPGGAPPPADDWEELA